MWKMTERSWEAQRELWRNSLPQIDAETIIECPYDKNHRVRESRLNTHLLKCRNTYLAEIYRKGYSAPVLTCKWSCKRSVLAPEILYHESRCSKASWRPPMYYKFHKDLEHLWTDEHEKSLTDIYMLDHVAGSFDYGRPTPVEDVKYPKQAEFRAKNKRMATQAFERAKALSLAEGTWRGAELGVPSPSKTAVAPASASSEGAEGGCFKYVDKDEEDFWNAPGKEASYDYLHNFFKSTESMLAIPPGLTKNQRKMWTDANAADWSRKHEEDLAAMGLGEMEELESEIAEEEANGKEGANEF